MLSGSYDPNSIVYTNFLTIHTVHVKNKHRYVPTQVRLKSELFSLN